MNAIFTVNYNNFLDQNTRDSFKYTADKWGCEYVECTEDVSYHASAQKLRAFELCDYERLFIIDADAIIRADAPNIFDITDPNKFYAVMNGHKGLVNIGYNPREDASIAVEEIKKVRKNYSFREYLDMNIIAENFFNAGVEVVSREPHAKVLDAAFNYFIHTDYLQWWDQMPVNLAVYEYLNGYEELGLEWNRRLPKNLNKMEGYVIHFAGDPTRYERIKTVSWKNI